MIEGKSMKLNEYQISRVKKLKDETGYGMLDCRKSLLETNWNIDKAKELLAEKEKYKLVRLVNKRIDK